MKIKKLFTVLMVFVMVLTTFTGCGTKKNNSNNNSSNNGTQNTADKSAYPGTSEANAITVNLGTEPADLCTITTTDTVSFSVIRHVIENLVELDAHNKVIPGVAKTWTVSPDGLTYTFDLRDDMKWSNGEPVTANDFVFAWKALLTPDYAAQYAYFGYIFKNGQKYNEGKATADQLGFKALSDYKLEVTLENPAPYFLNTLAFGVLAPMNEKAYKQFGKNYATDADKMVYNGPFKMTSWEHENKIVLEKNPDYPDANKIKLDKITMLMIKDTNAALNSFKAGECDLTTLNGDQVTMLKGENYPTSAYSDGSVFYLEYNMKDPNLANANLRKAITYAINKQAFIDSIVKNASKPATSFTAPGITGLKKEFQQEVGNLVPVFDTAKAKEYYAKALKELGVSTVKLTMISDDTDQAMNYAAFMQEQLKVNLGINIDVESMPFKNRLDRMKNKDFSMVFAGWGPDYNDPMTFLDMFETGNGNNHTSYTDPAYDDLLNKARKELDPTTRFGYLTDLEKKLMTDLPIGPIYWRTRDYVVSGKIKSGVIRTAFQDLNLRFVELNK